MGLNAPDWGSGGLAGVYASFELFMLVVTESPHTYVYIVYAVHSDLMHN